MVSIRCKCGSRLLVPETAVGKSGKCPFCQGKIRLVAPGFSPSDKFHGVLLVEQGPQHSGEQFLLGGNGPIEIGKLPDKAVRLTGVKVSRSHCRLIRTADGWRIEDQQSTNGLFVNQSRVSSHDLSEGDEIQVGEFVLRYLDPTHSTPEQSPPPEPAEEPAPEAEEEPSLDDDLYQLSEGEAVEVEAPRLSNRLEPLPVAQTGGPTCPSCGKSLAVNAKICLDCGIDLRTGRAILTSSGVDEDTTYTRAENTIGVLSWLVPAGIYPIASEAFGARKPYVLWSVAALTVLTSLWFLFYVWTDSPKMMTAKNYLLWCGERQPDPDQVLLFYMFTHYGDSERFDQKMEELGRQSGSRKPDAAREQELIMAAHNALPPDSRCFGRYAPSQLITHAFLHADLMHLAGNLVLLLVIGTRVNALLGNAAAALLYLLFAVAAGAAQVISSQGESPHPALGASGVAMGMAGIYLVLMPVYRIHMAVWWRWGLFAGFHLSMKLFSLRGFWVVFFYIGFDVFYVALKIKSGVAHWAHLGGFLTGVAVGLLLLLTRMVNARGGDIISALLGRHAWALVGKPNAQRKAPLEYLP